MTTMPVVTTIAQHKRRPMEGSLRINAAPTTERGMDACRTLVTAATFPAS